jgi:hypothetical protein
MIARSLNAPEFLRTLLRNLLPDGRLDTRHLLETFQAFYRENGESWTDRFAYREAGHQLMLQAFLQRVVNGSGIVEREYALGSGRADLLIRWKHPKGEQRVVFELKVLHKSLKRTLAEGQAQLSEYAERCAAHEAHLVVFHQKRGFAARRAFRKKRLKGRDFFIWSL